MAQYEHLPIYKKAFDLLVYFERIVKNFSRYHKYTHGSALRNIAQEVVMLIIRANNSQEKGPVLQEVRIKLEELKVVIRICKEIKAFSNFNSFETSINLVRRGFEATKLVVFLATAALNIRRMHGWLRRKALEQLSNIDSVFAKWLILTLFGAMTSLFVVLLQTIRSGCPPRPSEA